MTVLREQTENESLTEALIGAESALALPVIPGELEAWARRTGPELERLSAAWSRDEARREERLRDILKEDMELAQRVRQLRERQSGLSAEVKALEKAVLELSEDARGSWQPIARAEEARDRALIWVARARAFGAEIESWRREALYRDRGAMD